MTGLKTNERPGTRAVVKYVRVSPSKVRRISRDWGINYPIAMAPSSLQAAYDISTLPTTVVVGPDGQVKDIHVGVMSERQLNNATRD